MVNIGDRIRYDEQNVALDDIEGEVVAPTDQERDHPGRSEYPSDDVMVAWDDGERFWEDPTALVVVKAADE